MKGRVVIKYNWVYIDQMPLAAIYQDQVGVISTIEQQTLTVLRLVFNLEISPKTQHSCYYMKRGCI